MNTDDLIKEIHTDVREIRKDLVEIATRTTETRVILDEHINRDETSRSRVFTALCVIFSAISASIINLYVRGK